MSRDRITGAILPSPILAAYRWVSMGQTPRNDLDKTVAAEKRKYPSKFLAQLRSLEMEHAKLEEAKIRDEGGGPQERDAGAENAIKAAERLLAELTGKVKDGTL